MRLRENLVNGFCCSVHHICSLGELLSCHLWQAALFNLVQRTNCGRASRSLPDRCQTEQANLEVPESLSGFADVQFPSTYCSSQSASARLRLIPSLSGLHSTLLSCSSSKGKCVFTGAHCLGLSTCKTQETNKKQFWTTPQQLHNCSMLRMVPLVSSGFFISFRNGSH